MDFLIKAGVIARIIPQLGSVDLELASKDSRHYAIDFYTPQSDEETVEIRLPKYYRLKYLPNAVQAKTPWFEYQNTYEYKDNTITFKEKSINMAQQVKPKDYLNYKKAIEKFSKDIRQCIVLERVTHE